MLGNEDVRITGDEYAFVTRRLSECVHDLLRIADSRGARLDGNDAPLA